jgi:hypothetical protein
MVKKGKWATVAEEDMTEDWKVDEKFNDVIRNKMSTAQFWNWVEDWKDPEAIIEEAEEWDIKDKKEELIKFKKMGLLNEVV